jgi:hypothetical protein
MIQHSANSLKIAAALLLLTTSIGCAGQQGSKPEYPCAKGLLSMVLLTSSSITADGTKMAVLYTTQSTMLSELALYNFTTGEHEKIDLRKLDPNAPQGPIDPYALLWSDNGEHLIYIASDMIREVDIRGISGRMVVRCPNCVDLDLSSEGRVALTLYNTTTKTRYIEIKESLQAATALLNINEKYVSDPSWSPDGTKLAYLVTPSSLEQYVEIMDVTSNEKIKLDPPVRLSTRPVWLSNSTLLVPDKTTTQLWRQNIYSGERQLFADVQLGKSENLKIIGIISNAASRYVVIQTYESFPREVLVLDSVCLKTSK